MSPLGLPDCVLATNRFGRYCVPRTTQHRPAARAVLDGQVWEPHTIELARCTRPGGDIVHAGTFFGDFLPALSRSRDPGALVWAFEPNGESYRCARITAALNRLGNVRLAHGALGRERGSALLATSNASGMPSGGGSHIVEDPEQLSSRQRSEPVDVLCIDEAVGPDRDVALIQLDVEGHEKQALEGAMRTIERCRPLIVLESSPGEEWVARHLAPLGYVAGEAVEANVVFACPPR